ncbi:hypothetical protein H0H93_002017, partial [Arthromyces matolae]
MYSQAPNQVSLPLSPSPSLSLPYLPSNAYSHRHSLAWSNVSLHIFNLVFALFEIFFTNIPPPPPLMIPLCLVLLALYLGLAFITYATQGIY